jgi:hypothetical protein
MYFVRWSDEYSAYSVFYEYNSIQSRFVRSCDSEVDALNLAGILNVMKEEVQHLLDDGKIG